MLYCRLVVGDVKSSPEKGAALPLTKKLSCRILSSFNPYHKFSQVIFKIDPEIGFVNSDKEVFHRFQLCVLLWILDSVLISCFSTFGNFVFQISITDDGQHAKCFFAELFTNCSTNLVLKIIIHFSSIHSGFTVDYL